jgi:hypothetical protein
VAAASLLLSLPLLVVPVAGGLMWLTSIRDSEAEPVTLAGLEPSGLVVLWFVAYIALAVVWFATEPEEETEQG